MNDTYAEIDIDEYGTASREHSDELLLTEDPFKVPIVQNKAKDSDLNFPKQYKRLIECSERELFNIHNKEPGCTNNNIKGSSVDKRQVYVDFNAGMFEAVKKNFIRVLKEHFETQMNAKPKVETYGASKAEERVIVDLTMIVKKKQYDLKVHIYNTRCSLDVVAKGNTPQRKFKALDDQTAGEYFVKQIVPKVVEFLASKLDIKKMNELCRKQALLGHAATKSTVCVYCDKDNKDKIF